MVAYLNLPKHLHPDEVPEDALEVGKAAGVVRAWAQNGPIVDLVLIDGSTRKVHQQDLAAVIFKMCDAKFTKEEELAATAEAIEVPADPEGAKEQYEADPAVEEVANEVSEEATVEAAEAIKDEAPPAESEGVDEKEEDPPVEEAPAEEAEDGEAEEAAPDEEEEVKDPE